MASATATLTVPGLLVNVPRMRCWLQEVLAGRAVTAEVAFDLSVAVTEVCTNIIRHGYHDRASGDIDIRARKDGDTIRLTIVDTAPRFTPRDLAIPAPQALAEGGCGRFITPAVIPTSSATFSGMTWHATARIEPTHVLWAGSRIQSGQDCECEMREVNRQCSDARTRSS
jgi:anti-sigma regulatory factor (Ser/Thr protein kinase)